MRDVRAINLRPWTLLCVKKRRILSFFNLGPFGARRRWCVAINLGLPGPSPIAPRDWIPREEPPEHKRSKSKFFCFPHGMFNPHSGLNCLIGILSPTPLNMSLSSQFWTHFDSNVLLWEGFGNIFVGFIWNLIWTYSWLFGLKNNEFPEIGSHSWGFNQCMFF